MKKRTAYIASILTGAVITAAMLISRDIGSLTEPAQLYSALCDAFFIPGIILFCFGLLGWVASSGQFDMLSYAGHSLLVLFTPLTKPEKHQKFFEYKQARDARRKKPTPTLLIVGAGFMLIAAICLALYTFAI